MMEPFFPKTEYDLRYERARRLMAQKNLDALLATNVINYTYLGGHVVPGLAPWATRPFVLILPRESEPMLIGQSGAKYAMEKTSNIKKLKLWSSLPFGFDVIKEALVELKLAKARIGCELGLEERLGVSYNDFVNLQRSLPSANFVDASDVFSNLRIVKTQAEIECIKTACKATSAAYEKTFANLKVGMSVEEVQKVFLDEIIRQGLTQHFNLCRFWSKTKKSLFVRKEGVVWMDGGAVYKGYRCDFSRMVAVGIAHENVKTLYKKMRNITWTLIEMVKPGVTVAKLAETCKKECRKAGVSNLKLESMGRIGHGLGLGNGDPYSFSTELPSVSTNDSTVLEPGMIITLEPGETTDFGYFTLEEDLVVTNDGYELLTETVSEEEIPTVL